MSETLTVTVECHAGYRGEETPRAVLLGDRWIEVAAILDLWLAPEHRYFKFADPAGDAYIIRHDTMTGRWELTMFERGSADGHVRLDDDDGDGGGEG